MSIAMSLHDKSRRDGAIHRMNVRQSFGNKRDSRYMDFLQKVHATDFGHWSDVATRRGWARPLERGL
jgi:hypothetical protein